MKSKSEQRIALERIEILFNEAEKAFCADKKLADSYVAKARKIAMKYNVKMPRELKRKFCKHCYSYLKPGINLRVRTHKGKVVYYCMSCKEYMRFPYTKEKNKKKLSGSSQGSRMQLGSL